MLIHRLELVGETTKIKPGQPFGSPGTPLSVGIDVQGAMCVWFAVDDNKSNIMPMYTGREAEVHNWAPFLSLVPMLSGATSFLGTVTHRDLVWHFFWWPVNG